MGNEMTRLKKKVRIALQMPSSYNHPVKPFVPGKVQCQTFREMLSLPGQNWKKDHEFYRPEQEEKLEVASVRLRRAREGVENTERQRVQWLDPSIQTILPGTNYRLTLHSKRA